MPEIETLLRDAAARATRYIGSLPARRAFPTPEAIAALESLGGALPQRGEDPAALLRRLDEIGSAGTVASAGGRYFGFVTGGALPASLASSWLASAWDQNAFSETSSPAGAALEAIACRWLLEVLGLPHDAGVSLVTGATMANFAGLAAARHAQLSAAGWDVEADGLFGAPEIQVVLGEESHAALAKVLGFLGLGRDRTLRVPADGQGRMRADRLPHLRAPCIVCAQAGNVNSGAIDPIAEIVDRAGEAGAWVHVDGAFGLWGAASDALRPRVAGVELADSWATDAHKWLNVPYDCGVAIVRRPSALRAAMSISAAYLPADGGRQAIDYTPESSRRARGVEVWAALASLGRTGIDELVERTCRFARRFAGAFEAAGFEVLNEVCLNQVLVAFGDDQRTRRVIRRLQADGTAWCGGTVWQGRAAMRVSVSSWATTEADVERTIETIIEIARGES